jgi:hypothetical protein
MAVTKNVLPVANYQVWTSANSSEGDILGVYESLGGRGAKSVTLESVGGASRVRFNVVRQVYKEHGPMHNSWLGPVPGHSPLLMGEHEDTLAGDVVVGDGALRTIPASELAVRDIKIVNASGLRITVT